jgi:two-component system, chemotaxis family, sensor kinase CheA
MADMIDDSLLNEYLAESREHLANIESDLLTVESAGANIDETLVNKVFRAAHSIKGGAGFFGLQRIQELAHKVENVLHMVRSREMVPTPEVIGILLRSFDKLREMIDNASTSNSADVAEFVAALTSLASAHLPQESKASLVTPANVGGLTLSVTEFYLDRARRCGEFVYLVDFDLIHDIQRKGRTPLDLFQSLQQCGSVLDCQVDIVGAGTLDDEPGNMLMLRALVATVLEPSIASNLFEVPAERIQVVHPPSNDAPVALKEATAPMASPTPTPVEVSPEPHATIANAPEVAAQSPTESTATAASASRAVAAADTSLRVSVPLLESLMNLAGELVLSRNQLVEAIAHTDMRAVAACGQRINLVTSELQEAIMLTRMQPIGNIFAKFPRVVRDLSKDLNKDIALQIDGKDVAMDKTIIEGLSDPLTHMVRNAVDHGIETPEARRASGKKGAGTVHLRAYHSAGQVVIEISDDGKGISPQKVANAAAAKGLVTKEQIAAMSDKEKIALIFLPGLSTAEKVTDVSGRGVGMDVVKTNLDKLGGKVEIESVLGRGSTFRITLPLTLAIIPSLLVSAEGERFAIPQVNVNELIRVQADQVASRIKVVGAAEVLSLRGKLIPIVHLADVLGFGESNGVRRRCQGELNIVVVSAGGCEYGMIVDRLHDTVEIVVKPMGRHLKSLHEYAGATILGDGRVALILDVAGVASKMQLGTSDLKTSKADDVEQTQQDSQALLLFRNAPEEQCAVPLNLVSRVEQISSEQVEQIGGRRTMQYRGSSLPLVCLSDVAKVGQMQDSQDRVVIVFEHGGREVGLLAAMPVDVVESAVGVDQTTFRQRGVMGSVILKDHTTLLVDLHELVEPAKQGESAPAARESKGAAILLAEDSDFFRAQVERYLKADGHTVLSAPDGQAAWEMLQQHGSRICVVVTDIEMPRMGGLELARHIRQSAEYSHLPVIAVTSLASDEDIDRGKAAGVTEYQVKLDKEALLESVRRHMGSSNRVAA